MFSTALELYMIVKVESNLYQKILYNNKWVGTSGSLNNLAHGLVGIHVLQLRVCWRGL